jgi:uncharacterized RDD family membrane protein YckC
VASNVRRRLGVAWKDRAMTQIPAGWYPDPDPDAPEPKGQRYWDGQQWTEHLQPAPGGYPQPAQGGATAPGGYASYPTAGGYGGQVATATTPDGQPLAGWWRRVAAYIIDVVIINVVSWIVAFPAARDYMNAVNEMTEDLLSGDPGGAGAMVVTEDMAGPLATIGLVALVVSLVYNVAFLRWKSATPGKLALGLRVRLRETPGQLSYPTILVRWAVQNLNRFTGFVPVVGFLGSLFWLLDHLWPLWDPKKQAIHDKAAKTNVVRVR